MEIYISDLYFSHMLDAYKMHPYKITLLFCML